MLTKPEVIIVPPDKDADNIVSVTDFVPSNNPFDKSNTFTLLLISDMAISKLAVNPDIPKENVGDPPL